MRSIEHYFVCVSFCLNKQNIFKFSSTKLYSSFQFQGADSKFRMGDSDMSDLNLSDDEGFSGHEKILLEKHRSKLGKKSGAREV